MLLQNRGKSASQNIRHIDLPAQESCLTHGCRAESRVTMWRVPPRSIPVHPSRRRRDSDIPVASSGVSFSPGEILGKSRKDREISSMSELSPVSSSRSSKMECALRALFLTPYSFSRRSRENLSLDFPVGISRSEKESAEYVRHFLRRHMRYTRTDRAHEIASMFRSYFP